jgi:hypothetical protein
MNTWILLTIIEEDFDYSSLITSLSGGYVTNDVETTTINENGEEVVGTAPHPHANRLAPDFSGKIIFAHFQEDYVNYEGVHHIVINEFKNTKAWNDGVAYAKLQGATHVVIMNGVIKINPHVLELSIEEAPEVSIINISDGGVFIVNTAFNFVANEQYNFWFEDTNILNRASESLSSFKPEIQELELSQVEIKTKRAEVDAATEADFAFFTATS